MSAKKTTRVGRHRRPDPALADPSLAAPTGHLPGTSQKQDLMRRRVLAGLPATLPGDVVVDPAQRPDYKRLRNGYDKLQGAEADRAEAGVKKVVTHGNTFHAENRRLVFEPDPRRPPLGARLRELRKRRGLSLGQVSLETGISRAALSRLEAGERQQPHLCVLWRLADLFRVSIDELVGRGSLQIVGAGR